MVLQTLPQPGHTSLEERSSDVASARRHLLTVNVEDYFQVGVFQKFIQTDNWYRFESRLQQNVEQVLELLHNHNAKATFFVLGWTAEQQPELIRSIVEAGHEVASRGFLHRSLLEQPKDVIREDLLRAKLTIEDATGQVVDGFRLSDGWLSKETLWLLDEVAAAGYRYDSSLMPKQRDFADAPEWRRIREVQTVNGPLLEIPLSTMPTPGGWLPIAGGNYQRQLPDFVMRRLVDRSVDAETDPFVMYFQVWELDTEQPRLSMADRLTTVRHYRKLGKYRRILPQYLDRYQFTSVKHHATLDGSPLCKLMEPHTPAQLQSSRELLTALETARKAAAKSALADAADSNAAGSIVANAGEADRSSYGDVEKLAVTIVIPCFNEETSLKYLGNTLNSVIRKLSERYAPNILFVDDCSTDDTFNMLHQQFGKKKPAVKVVRHEVNKGVSAAILTGLLHAETDIVCSMDCDCSYDPHELFNMLPLMTDGVSLVTASPYHADGLVRNVPAWRLVLSRGLSWIYQRLLKQQLATWTSCFRVYRRSDILDLPLKEDGFLGTAELAAQLVLNKRPIVEYPATLEVRLFGLSKMKTVKAILSHLRLLARIASSRVLGGSYSGEAKTEATLVKKEVLR
ncbi:MAG: glycosyltransferase [Fuerstiella sp.]